MSDHEVDKNQVPDVVAEVPEGEDETASSTATGVAASVTAEQEVDNAVDANAEVTAATEDNTGSSKSADEEKSSEVTNSEITSEVEVSSEAGSTTDNFMSKIVSVSPLYIVYRIVNYIHKMKVNVNKNLITYLIFIKSKKYFLLYNTN